MADRSTPLLYIAGPMTGLPGFNYPAFHSARSDLEEAGFDVLCPTDNEPGEPGSQDWTWYMRASLRQVTHATGVAVLPGAACSAGALLEIQVARALGMRIQPVNEWIEEALRG